MPPRHSIYPVLRKWHPSHASGICSIWIFAVHPDYIFGASLPNGAPTNVPQNCTQPFVVLNLKYHRCRFVDRPVSWGLQYCLRMCWEVSWAAHWWTWTKKAISTGGLSSAFLRPPSLSGSACSSSPATFPGNLWRRVILHVLPSLFLAVKFSRISLHLLLTVPLLAMEWAFHFLNLRIVFSSRNAFSCL